MATSIAPRAARWPPALQVLTGVDDFLDVPLRLAGPVVRLQSHRAVWIGDEAGLLAFGEERNHAAFVVESLLSLTAAISSRASRRAFCRFAFCSRAWTSSC